MKNNPLTGEYSRFGSFDKLAENNRKQLRELIEEIAAKPADNGTVEQKIGDLYNLAMDSVKLNKDGIKPVEGQLKAIAALKSTQDLTKMLPNLLQSDVDAYFTVYVDADPMNSNSYLVQTYQSGISLGEREYYLDTDAQTTNIRNKYKEHVVKMFQLFGFAEPTAKQNMESVLKIETRLAKAAYDQVKLRDPHANYNKMSIADLQKLVPSINWNEYLKALGVAQIKDISVSQKESLIEAGNIIATEPLAAHCLFTMESDRWCCWLFKR
jgi:putative endopeptidase